LVVLTLPPDSDLPAIVAALRAGKTDGSWDFEEGCISEEWIRLTS
jgi:hypothetical protein